MLRTISLFLLICFSGLLHGQAQWGQINSNFLNIKSHQAFPDADAVILANTASLSTQVGSDGYEFVLIQYFRIHILTEKGIEEADRVIPYYSKDKYQTIINYKAQTVNLDGKKVVNSKLKRKEFFKEDDELSGRSALKFTFPQVKVGSILEFEYTIIQKRVFSNIWYFQNELPTIVSDFTFFAYPQLSHAFLIQGGFTEGMKRLANNRWQMLNIPGTVDEPFIPNTDDYRLKILVQLEAYAARGRVEKVLTTWEEFTEDFYKEKRFGKLEKENIMIGVKARSLTGELTEDKDKINAIYQFVSRNIEWNGERRLTSDRDLLEVFISKKGTSAEINLLLIRMLRDIKIKATPIFISTRAHGRIIKEYPLLNQFNTLACYVSSKGTSYLMDAINPLRPFNLPAYSNLNGEGWLMDLENPRWISISSKYLSKESVRAQLNVDKEGLVKGKIVEEYDGYIAIGKRSALLSDGEEDYQKAYYLKELPEGKIDSFKVENLEDPDEVLKLSSQIETSDFTTVNGDFIYLKPMLFFGVEENPFIRDTRYYPIDFAHRRSDEYSAFIILPEGLEIESLPKTSKVILPNSDISFTYYCSQVENAIKIRAKFAITKTKYTAHEYYQIKQMYDEMINRYTDQIVLKKVK